MIFNHPNLILAFSRRPENMSLVYGNTRDSLENRKKFLKPLGIDYRSLVCAKQTHGNRVQYVQEQDLGKGALSFDTAIDNTDALITDKKNIPLAIFTADCLSLFLYDPTKSAIGLVHAGWRSTQKNIANQTIRLMQEKFNTLPQDLEAGFGPAIRQCCYETDLIGINQKQLLESGVREKNIFDTGICTSCRTREFFSYHREGEVSGRMISVMMLK